MRAGQAGTALGLGRLGRSSNCFEFYLAPRAGRGSNLRTVLIDHHDLPLYRISHPPLFYHKEGNSKIQGRRSAEPLSAPETPGRLEIASPAPDLIVGGFDVVADFDVRTGASSFRSC